LSTTLNLLSADARICLQDADIAEFTKRNTEKQNSIFMMINESFPKLTSDYLKQQLNSRVSEIQYSIDLEGLPGEVFEYISFGKYFY